ncbi:helix-turn-helix domain-containing protein [Flavobacterium sp. UGB4466]|uniref:helix-turn-helix domain-containing protein n=1 Tax=Flavobacterium sp. UGB4466 TaxID=2730889 RepID=UPI00192BD1F5|nr:helix-turn-helix domain-containing protein [Flavobacterium sp. UGB4466]
MYSESKFYQLTAPLRIKQQASHDDLYIINFDLSEEFNWIQIRDISYKIGSLANLGLFVWKNSIENIYEHAAGKRIFTMRLIVDQKLLRPIYIHKLNDKLALKSNDKFDSKELCFHDLIDSNSRILIDSIKHKDVLNQFSSFYLKGVALKLLGNFIQRYSDTVLPSCRIKKTDLTGIEISKKYLLQNLKNKFPGIGELSKVANMSTSKYKRLFKEIEGVTPNDFFKREKIILAHQLLCSGSYDSIVRLAYDLNFTRADYFSKKYFKVFGRNPSKDLIEKSI